MWILMVYGIVGGWDLAAALLEEATNPAARGDYSGDRRGDFFDILMKDWG